ncbi:MAG TPA: hypothetical protein VNF75_09350 [Candidatus Dormibacteraeota bacterium]|nr:hypothetical protein [Candidatus Dormibacteraeota bacterium]
MTESNEIARSRRSGRRQELRHVLRLVSGFGARCDFCGSIALAVAAEVRPGGRQVAICRRCVGEAARRVHPLGGGDAA